MSATLTALSPGVFGKLPAHGDFIDRGWPAGIVAALDAWLSDGLAAMRAETDEADHAARMRAAPLWHGFVPAGMLGDTALYCALAPSVDRVGRLFCIVAGWAGDADAAWGMAHSAAAERLDALLYAALAGEHDADTLTAAIGDAPAVATDMAAPSESCWWLAPPAAGEAPLVTAAAIDAALLHRLLCEVPA